MKILTKLSTGLAVGVLAVSLFSCGGWKEVKSADFIKELDKLEETDVTKAKVEVKIEGNDDEANSYGDKKVYEFEITKNLGIIAYKPVETSIVSTAIAAALSLANLSLYKDLAKNYSEPTESTENNDFKYLKFYVGNGYKITTSINSEEKDKDNKVVSYGKNETTIEYNKAGLITRTYEDVKTKENAESQEVWHKEEFIITYSK